MNVNSSVALKAGLIGAAAGLVVAILGRVPVLGCIIGPLGWLVAVATGVLYVYLAAGLGERVTVSDGALGGGLSGAIAGAAQALVSGVLTLLFGAVRATSSLLGGEGHDHSLCRRRHLLCLERRPGLPAAWTVSTGTRGPGLLR